MIIYKEKVKYLYYVLFSGCTINRSGKNWIFRKLVKKYNIENHRKEKHGSYYFFRETIKLKPFKTSMKVRRKEIRYNMENY